jgi:hypothetical protein
MIELGASRASLEARALPDRLAAELAALPTTLSHGELVSRINRGLRGSYQSRLAALSIIGDLSELLVTHIGNQIEKLYDNAIAAARGWPLANRPGANARAAATVKLRRLT